MAGSKLLWAASSYHAVHGFLEAVWVIARIASPAFEQVCMRVTVHEVLLLSSLMWQRNDGERDTVGTLAGSGCTSYQFATRARELGDITCTAIVLCPVLPWFSRLYDEQVGAFPRPCF